MVDTCNDTVLEEYCIYNQMASTKTNGELFKTFQNHLFIYGKATLYKVAMSVNGIKGHCSCYHYYYRRLCCTRKAWKF